jgi:hypothetical protein
LLLLVDTVTSRAASRLHVPLLSTTIVTTRPDTIAYVYKCDLPSLIAVQQLDDNNIMLCMLMLFDTITIALIGPSSLHL